MSPTDQSTTKHTPGPWVLCHDGDVNDVDFATKEYRWPWQVLGANDEIVVDFTGGTNVTDADAALITAAPDLLAALLSTATFQEREPDGQPCWCSPNRPPSSHNARCVQAREAVTKATGGQP